MNTMNSITIRHAAIQDAPALLAIYKPYVETTAITYEYDVPSVEEFSARIASITAKFPYLVAELDGEIIGYAYASPFRERAAYAWSVETSIYMRMDMKHRGAGRLLYEKLEDMLAKQNVTNLYACIAVPNGDDPYLTRDSVSFHSHMGYRMIGEFKNCAYKFDRWYSMAMMEKFISPHITPQPPLSPFPESKEI